MIRAEDLTKRYGHHIAVESVSFTIEKGEILGLLGPNGAGKTTIMNIITGYLSATGGTVYVDGFNILDKPEEVKARIGYLPEQPPLYPEMTVTEYLSFVGELKKVPKREIKSGLETIMNQVGIGEVSHRLIRNLSKGYRQRVGLAQALIGNPDFLILDEPTAGLDPKQIIEIRNLIKELGKDHTILLSSHILPEVSVLCNRVIIINQGKIVASDTPENLSKRLSGASQILLRVLGTEDKITTLLKRVQGVEEVIPQGSPEEGTLDIVVKAGRDTDIRRGVFETLSDAHLPVLMMRPIDMSLEEIFLHLTTQEQGV